MSNNQKQIYCALDLETTGFDPLKEEIIEIGFVFFTFKKRGVTVLETYSQSFKPSKNLRNNIQALTGITEAELEDAPKLSEHRAKIQSKLKDAILVGHNIAFDAKFLSSVGIQLSGKTIDTLELVQFLLPTHHSYNLENLMHFFKLKGKNSHRALDDAKCAMLLFYKCLQIFSGLSKETKEHAKKLISKFEVVSQAFNQDITGIPTKKIRPKKAKLPFFSRKTILKNKEILCIPAEMDTETALAAIKIDPGTIFVFPDKKTAFKYFSESLVESVYLPGDAYMPEKFTEFLKRGNFTWEETIFILKIMVWQETNWQTKTTLDLNFNFFGGQFKNLITGHTAHIPNENNIATTLEGLLSIQKTLKDKNIIVFSLNLFEKNLLEAYSSRISWGNFTYEFKQNELPTADADLFFGLVSLTIQKLYKSESQILLEDFTSAYPFEFKKIKSAFVNFESKTKKITRELDLQFKKLGDFWNENQPDCIKWIEIRENHISFHTSPISVDNVASKIIENSKKFSIISGNLSHFSIEYYQKRLNLKDFTIVKHKSKSKVAISIAKNESDLVLTKNLFPAVYVFDNLPEMKIFYDKHFKAIQESSKLFAEKYSGGNNKIIKNFSLYKNSSLLCTTEFLKRCQTKLSINTLIIHSLPDSYKQDLPTIHGNKILGIVQPNNGPEEYLPEVLKCTMSKQTKNLIILGEFNNGEKIKTIIQDIM